MNKSDKKYLKYFRKRLYKALKIDFWNRIKCYWWKIFVYKPLQLISSIKLTCPTLMADKIPSIQPILENINSIISIKEVTESNKMKSGDYGHDYIYGRFIVDENGKEIYAGINSKEYMRLANMYQKKCR
jgi:hypothetical protein